MEKMTYYTIVLDGIDKCGKDAIAKYIWQLDKRLNIIVRGWPSLYAYNKKYNRNVSYKLPTKNALYVHLTVDEQDWNIRCRIHNEPIIDYNYDSELFNLAFDKLAKHNYHILTFNTTNVTAFSIATFVVKHIHSLNKRTLL